ncbi:MAG: T9SS type A sorting domain-containing protein, partial [Flavisolibacter sp.]
YPNPVTSRMQVSITGDKTTDYQVQLVNSSGQEIFNTKLKQVQSTVFTYYRNQKTLPGIYMVKITDLNTGITEIRKLIME